MNSRMMTAPLALYSVLLLLLLLLSVKDCIIQVLFGNVCSKVHLPQLTGRPLDYAHGALNNKNKYTEIRTWSMQD